MPAVLTSVDTTTVKFNTFTYTINASFNGLTDPITSAQITTFVPDYISYNAPPIIAPLQNIISTPVAGGTNIVFDFWAITDLGQAIVILFGMNFKFGTPNGTTYTATYTTTVNGIDYPPATAPTVTLQLVPNWIVEKSMVIPSNGQPAPGSTAYYLVKLKNIGDAGVPISNVTITDTLPTGLTLDNSFTPIGQDWSGTDASANANGTISGNTVTFYINSYYGTEYYMVYKVMVDPSITNGTQLTNTVDWWINGTQQSPVSNTVTVNNPYTSAGISKYGPQTSKPGADISYELYFGNYGNEDINNAYVIDSIPDEVIITKIYPGSFALPVINQFPNANYTVSYELNHSNNFVTLGSYPYNNTNYWAYVDLTGLGGKVTSLRWDFPVAPVGITQYNAPRLDGYVDPSTTATSTTNTMTVYWTDSVNGAQTYPSTVTTALNGVATIEGSKSNSPNYNVIPGQKITYTASMNSWQSPVDNPVIIDLLPAEVDYADNLSVGYSNYFDQYTWYDLNTPGTPLPTPVVDVISNYNSTGRTLVRITLNNFTLKQRSGLYVNFDTIVKVGATGTIVDQMYLGNKGTSQIPSWYPIDNQYLDTTDLDGDGITNETLFLTNPVTNGINFTTSLATDKKVKGQLDTQYTQYPLVGLTTQGGSVDYKLTITNTGNVDVEYFELVDILPHVGDTGVIVDNIARGSMFPVYITGTVTATLAPVFPGDPTPNFQIEYSNSYDPVRFDTYGTGTIGSVNDWSITPLGSYTDVKAIKLTSISTKLRPSQSLIIELGGVAPVGVPTGLIAWNSYALKGTYLDPNNNFTETNFLPVEPEKVGVQVQQPVGKVAIGDYVWLDTDQNGIQDNGEIGINDITVSLFDSAGTVLLDTTTTAFDINGNPGYYLFSNLEPGCYIVEFKTKINRLYY